MSAVIALLRAVNVGKRQVPAGRLRDLATGLGHEQVASYVNSGNLVLVPAGGASPEDVATGLSTALEDEFGFAVPVVARTAAQWDRIVAASPFSGQAADDPTRVVLWAWDDVPDVDSVRAFDPTKYGEELLVWHDRETYVYYPDGQGRSKLTPDVMARAAKRVGTARNWRTVLALQALAHDRA